jgi:hypothetical protein
MAGVLDGGYSGGWELWRPKLEGGDASSATTHAAALITAGDGGLREN